MKRIYDVLFLLAFAFLVIGVLRWKEEFTGATKEWPYLMGFLKFGILATFGEALKMRLTNKSWRINHIMKRAIVWGVFGVWITAIFPVIAGGVKSLLNSGMWPGNNLEDSFLKTIWIAFSMSIWVNVLSGYAWFMMLSHEWFNHCIEGRYGLVDFAKALDPVRWFKIVPKTILFFWIPSHTITFCLPPEWRILFAAGLSVALGALLTFKKPVIMAVK